MKISEVRNGLYDSMAEIMYFTTRSTYSCLIGDGSGFNKMGLLLVRISYLLSNNQILSFWEGDCHSYIISDYEKILLEISEIKKDILSTAKEIEFGVDMEKECSIFKLSFVQSLNLPATVRKEKDMNKEFVFD